MFRRSISLLPLLILLFASAALTHAAESLALPTWPQPFSISAGQMTQFVVAVTQEGRITAEVTWKGVPLTLAIVDPKGKAVASVAGQNPPATKVSYVVTAADLAKGFVWLVRITPPASKTRGGPPVAEGKVNVSPPPDMAKIRPALEALQAKQLADRAAQDKAITAEPDAGLNAIIAAADKARTEGINTSLLKLKTEMANRIAATAASLSQMVAAAKASPAARPPAARNTGMKPPAPRVRPKPKIPPPLKPPELLSVTPAKGFPGDHVTLTISNAVPDATQYDVFFTIGAGDPVQGSVSGAVKNGDLVDLDAVVPGADVRADFEGPVYVVAADRDPAVTTNTKLFKFQANQLPVLSSFTPSVGEPGLMLRLDGKNFKADDQVHFLLNDGKDVAVAGKYFSPTQMTVIVPDYTALAPFTGQIYVEGKFKSGPGYSDMRSIVLSAVQPISKIDSTTYNLGSPGYPVLISGSGFRSPAEVHFIISKSGKDVAATKIDSVSSTQILAYVPGVSGVTAFEGQLYVVCAGQKSNPVTFTFTPILEWKSLKQIDCPSGCYKLAEVYPDRHYVSSYAYDLQVTATHFSLAAARWGDDQWFMNQQLFNGWVVNRIDLKVFKQGTVTETAAERDAASDAYVVESYEGTDQPLVKIHFFSNPPGHSVRYVLRQYIKGPLGVAYDKPMN